MRMKTRRTSQEITWHKHSLYFQHYGFPAAHNTPLLNSGTIQEHHCLHIYILYGWWLMTYVLLSWSSSYYYYQCICMYIISMYVCMLYVPVHYMHVYICIYVYINIPIINNYKRREYSHISSESDLSSVRCTIACKYASPQASIEYEC